MPCILSDCPCIYLFLVVQFQEALDKCRDLLVETYRNMSEPDGFYGLVRDGHLSSEFYLYEHEGTR